MTRRIGKLIIKDLLFFVFTIILIVLISLLFKGTVYSMPKSASAELDEKYFISIEKQYVSEIKDALADEGYLNAGVMLTKIVDADGNREYTLCVNHKKLSDDAKNKNIVASVIEGIELPVENSGITVMMSY